MPFFKEKLGKDVPMQVTLTYRDMEITFGHEASNIIFEYVQQIELKFDQSSKYRDLNLTNDVLYYDEVKVFATMDLDIGEDNLMYPRLNKFELDRHGKYGFRDYPIRSHMDITKADYSTLLMQLKDVMDYIKRKEVKTTLDHQG